MSEAVPMGINARHEAAPNAHRQPADYAMAFAFLGELASARVETEAVAHILHVFETLCAPTRMRFLSVVDGRPGAAIEVPPTAAGNADASDLLDITGRWERTETGTGFRLCLADGAGTLGVLEVDDLEVPANIDHYLNLGLGLVDVCALALRNARTYEALQQTLDDLRQAMAEVKTLQGLLPICSACKRIRDESGAWSQVETYVMKHSDASFTHGICPGCRKRLYPDFEFAD